MKKDYKFQPATDRVVIRPIEEKYEGKLFIPETASKDKPKIGVIEAFGGGPIIEGGRVAMKEMIPGIETGKKAIYSPYAGTPLALDGEEFILVRWSEIHGIIEEVNGARKKKEVKDAA